MSGAVQAPRAPETLGAAAILELADPIGVLSVYVDADPALAGGPRPAWQARVRTDLRRLRRAARGWPRAERLAFEARLEELGPELDSLLDPRGASRGRALFVGVGDGERRRVELRTPLPSLVRLDSYAWVLPLLAAEQAGQAAGVVAVSAARVELAEWELDALLPLETIELPAATEDGRGRPLTNPALPQAFPERDRFESGAAARAAAHVREAGERVAAEASGRGWDLVLADGDPRLLEALEAGFPAGAAAQAVRSPRPLAGLSGAAAAERAGAIVRELRAERTARLVRRLDGSAAATRDPLVLERALEQGRVGHLLLAAPDGSPPDAAAESLLRQALATGAEVTVVDGRAAGLAPAAALLRW